MKGLGIWWERSRLCTVIVILLSLFPEVTFAQVDVLQPSLKISRETTGCYPCLTGDFWTQEKRSVVRIITFREGETIMCTGTLVNNTAQDGKPYILTANHCLMNQQDVDQAIFTFGHEDINCDGVPLSHGASMAGAKLRSSSYENDFTLIELDHHVPFAFHPYFAGWNVTGQKENLVSCIHHPQAGVKRIAIEHEFVESSNYDVEGTVPRAGNAFWKVKQWDIGFTERGSSGAPLFDQQHRVVGTLSGGKSACDAPYDDYFQKLSASWNASESAYQQLRHWLDPVSSGVTVMDGFDPVAGLEVSDDTITNIFPGEPTRSLMYANDKGYIGGCNNNHITSFAEEFYRQDSAMVTGIQLFLGVVESDATGGVVVSVNAAKDGEPGTVLAEMYVPYSKLKFSSNYLEFYPGVNVSGKFFITCSPDCAATNQFAIDQVDGRTSHYNTAWAMRDSDWIPMNELNADGFGSSFYIEAILSTFHKASPGNADLPVLNLYPNPTTSTLICSIQGDQDAHYQIAVCNSRGQNVNVEMESYGSDFILDVSRLDSGVYFLKINTLENTCFRKFLKR